MQLLHNLNITIHVIFGTIGLLIGLLALFYRNRSQRHIRYGLYFLYTLTIVVGTAFIGILCFRSNPFLLLLTLLGGYVGYSGFRTIRLREQPASTIDLLISIGVLITGGIYLGSMELAGGNWSPSVVYPTLSALVLVAGYDLIKRLWLFDKLKTWWLYEHIYKMISAYSAILSAFSGTVFPQYKPCSQILPSALCVSAIIYFIWQQAKNRKSVSSHSKGLGMSEPKQSYSS
ncbi:hypothetical protein [Spirosoma endbachense]|uniref:hypothetical protein n=1 Tax=Spirosoma endbachense TaxID=2666025 RepID=UPI0018E0B53C|nr:hypothetical protein [Spirosoma endbachense]